MGTNFVMVSGDIGYEPEIRGKGDSKTVSFVVPVDEFWTDKNGLKNKHTEWMRCVIFNRNAQVMAADGRLKKGTTVVCKGSNRTESYIDNKGVPQKRTKIFCSEIAIVEVIPSSPINLSDIGGNKQQFPDVSANDTEPHSSDDRVLHSSNDISMASRLFGLLRSLRTAANTI